MYINALQWGRTLAHFQAKGEEVLYNPFNNLGFAFDKLLAIVEGKPEIVHFVEQSGQADVKKAED